MTSDGLPLAGVRVIDLSRVLAGPYCCALLAEQGAEIVKVERPGTGDENRHWGHKRGNVGIDFLNVNRGKRGITVDLSKEQGKDVLRRLISTADVLVENFVPGTMERFGLSHEALIALNPRLIHCAISAFGERGALSSRPGYDGALQAFTGHMSITGEADGGPVRSGASVMDMSSGMAAYGAVVTALLSRAKTGKGQKVSLSLMKTALALMGTHGAAWLNGGVLPSRAGSGVSHLAPYSAFRTTDGYVVIGVLNEERWRALCRELGAEDLVQDKRYSDMQTRLANRKDLEQRIETITLTKSTAQWCSRLADAGVVAAPVNTLAEALGHAQVAENDMVLSVGDGARQLRLVGGPMSFSAWSPSTKLPPPELGEHTDDVLREAGYEEHEIKVLRACKAV